ncbi:PH domain-containing protein [Bizionia sediminis]|uniref:PH domain-containing protein n=1 Tax=Bizionia sediminis TaxID=1737064 RepID=A0ABW5KU17_9FLAO
MHFKSRKDSVFVVISLIIIGFLLVMLYNSLFLNDPEQFRIQTVHVMLCLLIGLLIWLGLDTSYRLTPTTLFYKSGPIRGRIEITNIHEVVVGKTLWSGLKPATARHGLIIKYNKYEEIYISPKTNTAFIKTLKAYKPDLKISYSK